MLNAHLLPAFGPRYLRSITAAELQTYLNRQSGMSQSHLVKMRMILRLIFRYAMAEALIERDPATILRLPAAAAKVDRRPLTLEETEASLRVGAEHPEGLFLLVLYYLGLRRGEALGLLWQDINYSNHTLHVQRDVDFKAPLEQRLGPPKTPAANRQIPIPDPLYAVLAERRGVGLIFHGTKSGLALAEASYCRMWARLMNAVGSDQLTPHYYRHNYASLLYAAGVPVLQAKDWLGHTDIAITLGIYSHLDKEASARNAQQFIGFFRKLADQAK